MDVIDSLQQAATDHPLAAVALGSFALYKFLIAYHSRRRVPVKGKAVFITGCDTGFGRALALSIDAQFATLGVTVIAGCLSEKTVDEYRKNNRHIIALQMDVTNAADVARVAGEIQSRFPDGLWGVVNNAGIGSAGLFELMSVAEFRRVLEVNLVAHHTVTNSVLSLIQKAEGRIVNIASVAGFLSAPGMFAYSASKHGVEALSDALRLEMKPWNVSVSIIEPGFFKTEIVNKEAMIKFNSDQWASLSQELRDKYGEEFRAKSSAEALKVIEGTAATDITPVVQAIQHALFSTYPQPRYLVGNDANYLWSFFAILPTWISDGLVETMISKNPPQASLATRSRRRGTLQGTVVRQMIVLGTIFGTAVRLAAWYFN